MNPLLIIAIAAQLILAASLPQLSFSLPLPLPLDENDSVADGVEQATVETINDQRNGHITTNDDIADTLRVEDDVKAEQDAVDVQDVAELDDSELSDPVKAIDADLISAEPENILKNKRNLGAVDETPDTEDAVTKVQDEIDDLNILDKASSDVPDIGDAGKIIKNSKEAVENKVQVDVLKSPDTTEILTDGLDSFESTSDKIVSQSTDSVREVTEKLPKAQDVIDSAVGDTTELISNESDELLSRTIDDASKIARQSALAPAIREVSELSPIPVADAVTDPITSAVKNTENKIVNEGINVSVAEKVTEPVFLAADKAADQLNDVVDNYIDSVDELASFSEMNEKDDDGDAATATDVVDNKSQDPDLVAKAVADQTAQVDELLQFAGSSKPDLIPLNKVGYENVEIMSNPELTTPEKQQIAELALDVDELEDWSPTGEWKVVGMDFVGVVKPEPRWETAVVYLRLPDNSGNPPISCHQGWQAVIDVDLESGEVERAGVPTKSSHECTNDIVLEEPTGSEQPYYYPPSNPRPSFVIAETDDVVSSEIHGTAAHLNTPRYNSTIFENMDSYLAFLLNQKWSTLPIQHMTQIGWVMSSIDGCIDCGSQSIDRENATLAFTDSSVFGNLEAHRIPSFEWIADGDLVAGTWCNNDGKYLIWAQYGGKVFNHNTNISCANPDNNSKTSNSVFFENWNTGVSGSWAGDLGPVEAHSAIAFRAGDVHNDELNANLHWQTSTNEEQQCTASRQLSVVIQGGLASGGAARWANLKDIPSGC